MKGYNTIKKENFLTNVISKKKMRNKNKKKVNSRNLSTLNKSMNNEYMSIQRQNKRRNTSSEYLTIKKYETQSIISNEISKDDFYIFAKVAKILQIFYNIEEKKSNKIIKLNNNNRNVLINNNKYLFQRKNNKFNNIIKKENEINKIIISQLSKNKIKTIIDLKKKGFLTNNFQNKKRLKNLYDNILNEKINKEIIEIIKIFIETYKKILKTETSEESKITYETENIKFFKYNNNNNNTLKNYTKNNTLTPIPKKRNKTKKDEIEFEKASRASYVIRRIEYSNYVSSGNTKYNKFNLLKLNKKTIIIQRWWKKMMENNTFLYKVILIQSFYRRYFFRCIFYLCYILKKNYVPGINKIMLFYYKFYFEKYFNLFLSKFAFLYQFKIIYFNVNLIIKNFRLFKKRNKNIFQEKNNNFSLLKGKCSEFFLIKNFYNLNAYICFLQKILLIQNKFHKFYKKKIKEKYDIEMIINLKKKKELKRKNFILNLEKLIIKYIKKRLLKRLYKIKIKSENMIKIKEIMIKIIKNIEENKYKIYFILYNKKIKKIKNLELSRIKVLGKITKIYEKKLMNKKMNISFERDDNNFRCGFIIIKYIIYKHIHFRFDELRNLIFKNLNLLKQNFTPNSIYFISKNNKINEKFNSIFKKLFYRQKILLKIKFTQFKFISKMMKYYNKPIKKELNEKNDKNKKQLLLTELILKKDKRIKLNNLIIFIKWRKITKKQSLQPIEKLFLILYKIFQKKHKEINLNKNI